MPKCEKGILGIPKDPMNPVLFSFNVRGGEEWPSDDSDDSDYNSGDSLGISSKSKENSSSDETESSQDTAKKNKSVEIPSKKRKRDGSNRDGSIKKKKAAEKKILSNSIKCATNVHLPEEVWTKIFHFVIETEGALPFLPRASRVCRSFYKWTNHPSLWKKVDLSDVWAKVDVKCMAWLCQNRFSETTDLNLSLCIQINRKILKMISQNCANIRSINLSCCKKCPFETLTILAEGCKLLEDVDVSFTNNDVMPLSPLQGFIHTQGSCLRRLTLGGRISERLSPVLNDLIEKCPNLELLHISNTQVSNNIMTLNIEKFQAGCPQLKILRLANCPFKANPCSLREQTQSEGFFYLKEMSITSIYPGPFGASISITADSLCRILKTSYNLKLLDMHGISLDRSFESLLDLPIEGLERLYMSNSAVAGFDIQQDLIRKWKNSLLEVDLSWNSFHGEILDLDMNALTQGEGQSPIQRLNIAGTPVNLSSVLSILELCKDLQYLNLTSCRAIPRGFKREYRNIQEIARLREDILKCRDSE